jgi:hypothetical protein
MRDELTSKRWRKVWSFMEKTYAKLFFDHDQLWALVSYQQAPIFIGGYFRDPDYPGPVNDNELRA